MRHPADGDQKISQANTKGRHPGDTAPLDSYQQVVGSSSTAESSFPKQLRGRYALVKLNGVKGLETFLREIDKHRFGFFFFSEQRLHPPSPGTSCGAVGL